IFGKVKEFASLANLKVALSNEGFSDIVIKYMGELWVMLEFKVEESLLKFQESISAMSWFSQVVKVTPEFEVEGRIAWVEVEGIPFKLWTSNTFARIAEKWGKLLDVDDEEETCYHSKRLCIHMKSGKSINEEFKIIHRGKIFWIRANETPGWVPDFTDEIDNDDINSTDDEDVVQKPVDIEDNSDIEKVPNTFNEEEDLENKCDSGVHSVNNLEKSEDPFNLYSLLNRKDFSNKNANDSDSSLKFPPGFTPPAPNCDDDRSENIEETKDAFTESYANNNLEENNVDADNNCFDKLRASGGSKAASVCSGSFKKSSVPRSGGSFLGLMEEVVKVGQTMGLGQKAKKDWVRKLCVSNKVNFLAIQETKMESMDLRGVKSCWGNYAFEFSHSNSVGNSGGILCVWDPGSFHKHNHTLSDYFVILRGVWLSNGADLLVVVVYGPHDLRDKRDLWDYLLHTVNSWKGEIVMMGDFNEVRYKSDRFGSAFNAQGAEDFNSFITSAGLVEVLWGSPHFSAITLERYLSDHCPILLRELSFDYGPIPFRFFHHWLELDGFYKYVTEQWNIAPVIESNGLSNLMGKLKFIKTRIREWLKCNNPCNSGVIIQHKEDLRLIDEVIDNGKGSDTVVAKRMEVLNELQRIEKLHAMDMAQKAKIKWSIEGDENSRFFHGVLNKKRNQMNVRGVMVDGVWQEQPFDVKPELERDVSKEELKQAVWDCGLDKSPGSDGFSFGFYRHFWATIENDVFKAVKHFFLYADIPKGCNSSFIALIPKIPNANLSAFIKGRQILDGPFILNEVIQWCKSKKKQSLIFKVDFEKAFDTVRWDFLDDVLKKFGFGNKWCEWIQKCLKSSRGSILVNGSPTEEFQFFKGLKQGDPLSPFLFILVMECLHLSFQNVVDAGMFTGISLNHSVNLSHMFYADDAVFVGQWNDQNINTLTHVLECFYHASGLRINMSKITKVGDILSPVGGFGTKVIEKKNSLWSNVIKAIHGKDGNIGLTRKAGVRSCWTSIVKETKELQKQGVNVFDYLGLKLGNGDSTSFWYDNWSGVGAAKDLYPSGCISWVFSSSAEGGDIEQAHLDALATLLARVNLVNKADRWVWTLEGSGEFSVASTRKVIDENRLKSDLSKTIWVKYVPIKINVLAWKIKMDALPTRLNISRRGIDIHSISCPICDNGIEASDHLFFRCQIATQLTRKIVNWWNIDQVDVNTYVEWCTWLSSLRMASKSKAMLEGVFYVMWWYLWTYRNHLIFGANTPPKASIFDNVVSSSFHWCNSRCKASFKWIDWLKNPYLITL
ncbi:RNA-directed DNA polymerase, eukaryota, partial [Tanacetum coccineum]